MKKVTILLISLFTMMVGCKNHKTNDNPEERISTNDAESQEAESWPFEKPDYDMIEKLVSDKNSDMYYPKLFERYLRADTSMTQEERRCLYYGYVFQPDYAPYDFGTSTYNDSIQIMLDKKVLTNMECDKMISYADSLLSKNPFFVRGITLKLQMYEQLRDSVSFYREYAKLPVIYDAILSSGNGISEETAFYVINTRNEYEVLDYIGFSAAGQSLVGTCDYLHLEENSASIEGLYFNIEPCLKHLGLAY